ncbi:hypothetical protein TNIN_485321 [Trichonephila inaurata madagascariensis]|uniref:Uncharacterized protein n=1 Tax=Trichonephila inaurata madagascariensis TaxID=2747483 RepID=A0A8X6JY34_9ARAC|nr:hypothetical protein TNIN_485321 [Trichonephila inaurata madagascariensis]
MAGSICLGHIGHLLHPFHFPQLERGSERHVPVLDRSGSLAVAGLHHPGGCQPLLSAGSHHCGVLHHHCVHHLDKEPPHELPKALQVVNC